MIFRTIRLQPKLALFALLLIFLTSLSVVGLMASSAWLISMASLMPPVLVLSVAVVGVRAFAIGRSVFRYSERLVSHDVAFRMLGQTRLAVFQELNLDRIFRDSEFRYGDIYQRITGDVEQVQDGWLRVILPFFSAITAALFGFLVLFWLVPAAGSTFITVAAVAIIAIPFLVSRFTNRTENVAAQAKSDLTAEMLRTYESLEEIAIFGGAEKQIARLTEVDTKVNQIGIRRAKYEGAGTGFVVLVTGVAIISMILFAQNFYLNQELAGVNVAVLTLLPIAALESLLLLPLAGILIRKVNISQRRLTELTVKSQPRKSLEFPSDFTLELEDFVASWKPELQPKQINSVMHSGDVMLITGTSGSGKSSLALGLINLLPYSGSARIGGIEINQIPESNLSQLICLATQDAKVFNTSLRENLLIANKDASESDLQNVLSVVDINIADWPDGLDTDIGITGRSLSGGERNRISIARALLSPARILVLDEPTEYLEHDAGTKVIKNVLKFAPNKTFIIITHRDITILDRSVELVEL